MLSNHQNACENGFAKSKLRPKKHQSFFVSASIYNISTMATLFLQELFQHIQSYATVAAPSIALDGLIKSPPSFQKRPEGSFS
jgi:hypothetical protein